MCLDEKRDLNPDNSGIKNGPPKKPETKHFVFRHNEFSQCRYSIRTCAVDTRLRMINEVSQQWLPQYSVHLHSYQASQPLFVAPTNLQPTSGHIHQLFPAVSTRRTNIFPIDICRTKVLLSCHPDLKAASLRRTLLR